MNPTPATPSAAWDPDPTLTADQQKEYDKLIQTRENSCRAYPGRCHCGRLTDHRPLGTHNVAICRFCWVRRSEPGMPEIITITAEELLPEGTRLVSSTTPPKRSEPMNPKIQASFTDTSHCTHCAAKYWPHTHRPENCPDKTNHKTVSSRAELLAQIEALRDRACREVAAAAENLTPMRGVRFEEAVVLELPGWKVLQDALGEYRAASRAVASKESAP